MHTYELWSTQSRNLIDWFDDEAELRVALGEMTDFSGIALARRDERGQTTWIAEDAAILRHFTPLQPKPART